MIIRRDHSPGEYNRQPEVDALFKSGSLLRAKERQEALVEGDKARPVCILAELKSFLEDKPARPVVVQINPTHGADTDLYPERTLIDALAKNFSCKASQKT